MLCIQGGESCDVTEFVIGVSLQGCHTSGKSQGKVVFFKVREMSGNFEICQGKNEF